MSSGSPSCWMARRTSSCGIAARLPLRACRACRILDRFPRLQVGLAARLPRPLRRRTLEGQCVSLWLTSRPLPAGGTAVCGESRSGRFPGAPHRSDRGRCRPPACRSLGRTGLLLLNVAAPAGALQGPQTEVRCGPPESRRYRRVGGAGRRGSGDRSCRPVGHATACQPDFWA